MKDISQLRFYMNDKVSTVGTRRLDSIYNNVMKIEKELDGILKEDKEENISEPDLEKWKQQLEEEEKALIELEEELDTHIETKVQKILKERETTIQKDESKKLRKNIYELNQEKERYKKENNDLKTKVDFFRSELSSIKDKREQYYKKEEDLRAEILNYKVEIKELNDQIKKASKERSQATTSGINDEENREKIQELGNTILDLKEDIKWAEDNHTVEINKYKETVTRLIKEKQVLKHKLNNKNKRENESRSLNTDSIEDKFGIKWKYIEEDVTSLKRVYTLRTNPDKYLTEKIPTTSHERDILVSENKPMNYILEGENYGALKVLEKTHYGNIGAIYGRVPQPTELHFNGKPIESNSRDINSKFTMYMKNRLDIASRLLKDDGIVVLKVGDGEVTHIRMLMDTVFGEDNYLGTIIWKERKYRNKKSLGKIHQEHRYILIYSKNREKYKEIKKIARTGKEEPYYSMYLDENVEDGREHLRNIMGGTPYSNPATVNLIKHCLRIKKDSKDDIFLDFMSDTGAMGEAVLEMNKEDGGNRTYIMVGSNIISEQDKYKYFESIGKIDEGTKDAFNEYYKENKSIVDAILRSDTYKSMNPARNIVYRRMRNLSKGYYDLEGNYNGGIPHNIHYLELECRTDSEYRRTIEYGNPNEIAYLLSGNCYIEYPKHNHLVVAITDYTHENQYEYIDMMGEPNIIVLIHSNDGMNLEYEKMLISKVKTKNLIIKHL